ncbi:MAG TPA: GNAT family N-acetyltransferase [Kofleriaceae bacterium]
MGYRIDWKSDVGQLVAYEPTLEEVAQHADVLARGYNEPRNAELMGHTEHIGPEEVVELFEESAEEGVRSFLLFRDGNFVGDGDLRGIHDGTAEFAFMIGAPTEQGKGLGTRFAQMIHVFGFTDLKLTAIYASIAPANSASRRVFDKLGYILDEGDAYARSYADEPDDIVMMISREMFQRANAEAIAKIRLALR